MTKRLFLTLFLLFACLAMFAQNPGDIVHYSTKPVNIKLTFADTSYTRSETFRFDYSSETTQYTVRFSAAADTFVMSGDLNLGTFKDLVNNLATSNWQLKNSISDNSAQQMFFMIYSRSSDDDTADIAGTLLLRDEIMVETPQNHKKYYYEQRIHIVDSLSGIHSAREAELNGNADSLKIIISAGIDTLRKIKPGKDVVSHVTEKNNVVEETKVTDTNNTNNIKKTAIVKKPKKPNKADTTNKTNNTNTADTTNKVTKTSEADSLYAIDTAKYKIDTANLIKNIVSLKSAKNFSNTSLEMINKFVNQYGHSSNNLIANKYKESLKAYKKLIDDKFASYTLSQKKVDTAQKLLDSFGIYHIDEIALQFEKGFLERVKASISVNGTPWIFENIYAIGFSSTNNFRNLNKMHLYRRKTKDGYNKFIYLSDLFKNNYNNELENYTRDYSPADTTLNHVNPSQVSFITLYKANSVHLFDSKIYTDLNGLSDNSPNGLLQTDISRRFNINTVRHQCGDTRADVGYFNYINIYGTLNKIENRQRYLALRNQNIASNDSLISPTYATNMDFLRYRNGTLGISTGVFLFDYPDGKFTFYVDLGAEYGHTPVLNAHRVVDTPGKVTILPDSLHLDANMATFYPRFTFEVFSERRIGFKLSYQYNYTLLFSNNQFKQVMSYEKSDLTDFITEKKARQSSMMEFFVRAQTSKSNNNEIFFRARFFWQWGDAQTFFPQVQLGYNFNLIFKKQ